jgi:hypothetical protein
MVAMQQDSGSPARETAHAVADESRLRASMDALLDPHIVLEAVRDGAGAIVDFRYVDANPAACASSRLSRRDLVGTHLLARLPGAVESDLFEKYRRVVETGEPLVFDGVKYPTEFPGHEQPYYDVRAVRLGDGLSVTLHDVTDRHVAVEALRAQRDLAVALGSVGDLREALALIMEAALSLDGVDCGGVYMVDLETGALDLTAHAGISPEFVAAVSHFPPDANQTRLIMAGVSVFRSHDELLQELGTQREVHEGLRAFAAVPIRHEGSVVAAMNLASRSQDEFTRQQRVFIETLAAQAGGVLVRLLAGGAERGKALGPALRDLEALIAGALDGTEPLGEDGRDAFEALRRSAERVSRLADAGPAGPDSPNGRAGPA